MDFKCKNTKFYSYCGSFMTRLLHSANVILVSEGLLLHSLNNICISDDVIKPKQPSLGLKELDRY